MIAGNPARTKKFTSWKILDVISWHHMIKKYLPLFWLVTGLYGCSAGNLTPGATLLAGMQQYQGDMQSLGGSPSRWPERQQAAGTLKTVVLATLGGSREFYRMVDLDLRKTEFAIAMHQTTLRADRLQEMKDELVKMNDEVVALKPIVRAQIATIPIQGDAQQRVEGAATRGLLTLSLDAFSASDARSVEARSTKVDQYVVTDLGSFSTVRSPEGQNFRCTVFNVPEEGGWIKCDPVK